MFLYCLHQYPPNTNLSSYFFYVVARGLYYTRFRSSVFPHIFSKLHPVADTEVYYTKTCLFVAVGKKSVNMNSRQTITFCITEKLFLMDLFHCYFKTFCISQMKPLCQTSPVLFDNLLCK